jgi:hypothetical protein
MFIGAINAFGGDPGTGVDQLSGARDQYQKVARHYKAEGLDAQFVVLQARALVTAGLSGNVDVVPIPSGGAQAALSGAAITYIVGESLKSQWTIVTPKSIENVESLKGKTLGYGRPGSADYDEGILVLQRFFRMEAGRDYKVILSGRGGSGRRAGQRRGALISVPHAARRPPPE